MFSFDMLKSLKRVECTVFECHLHNLTGMGETSTVFAGIQVTVSDDRLTSAG